MTRGPFISEVSRGRWERSRRRRAQTDPRLARFVGRSWAALAAVVAVLVLAGLAELVGVVP